MVAFTGRLENMFPSWTGNLPRTHPFCSAFCTLTHCSTCSRLPPLFTCLCMSRVDEDGTLWYVPVAMPLGSIFGLGVSTRPFRVQRPSGKVEADLDGAREGALDVGAEADVWSDCERAGGVVLEGRELCVSISRVLAVVTGKSLGKLQRSSVSRCMGSKRTSWIMVLLVSESEVLVLWWFTWLVCGTACCCCCCCCNTLSFSDLSDGLQRAEITTKAWMNTAL